MNSLIDQTFQISSFNYMATHPVVLISLTVIIIVYYTIFLNLGNSGSAVDLGSEGKIIEIIMWGILLFIIVLNGSNYMFNIDIITLIKGLFTSNPKIDIINNENKPPVMSNDNKAKKQVFHISNNKYNYNDSKAICAAYGGRLANLNDMNKAYKDGASWCSYGWSEDKMILFPTQQKTLDQLKNNKQNETSCGRLGVNGGHIEDTEKKYGVNCYGFKPTMSGLDLDYLDRVTLYPKSKEDKEIESRVDYWKSKMPELRVAPFNNDSWDN